VFSCITLLFVEEKMLKPVIAATAVLAIAGSSFVYAQQRFGDQWGPRSEQRHPISPADMAAFTDARIAALKAGLELTPDQLKNWPAFEQALRDFAKLRADRIAARQQQAGNPQGQSPFDRLQQRADNLAKVSAALKKIADAGAPLYQSLTDDQKARFHILARMLRPHPRERFAFYQRDRGWHGGRGFGPQPQFGPRGGGDGGNDGGGNDGGNDGRGNDGGHGSQL
jgi:zinc resistance-associated protein